MVTIVLTRGLAASVDDIDMDLNNLTWHVDEIIRDGIIYHAAVNSTIKDGKVINTIMHREIMSRIVGRSLRSDEIVNHKDGDRLNNIRSNLRLGTYTQAQGSRPLSKNNTSGYKGVGWHKRSKKWQAKIQVAYKRIWLGEFDSIDEAAIAYAEAAKKYFGDFARLK